MQTVKIFRIIQELLAVLKLDENEDILYLRIERSYGITSAQVQLRVEAMTKVAKLQDWTLNKPRKSKYFPYEHTVGDGEIEFMTISTDPIPSGESTPTVGEN